MLSCNKCEEYTNIYSKWCKPCQIDNLKTSNLTSGNEKIDNLIQEMQLKIDSYDDLVFEWIPYNQFSDIKEIGRGGFSTVYLAIWKDGKLNYDKSSENYVKSTQNQQVALKCLHNSQNIINEFLNKIKAYSIKNYSDGILKVYGISQNPDTKDYIIVLQDKFCKKCGEEYTNIYVNWCKPCQIDNLKTSNLTSGNEKIDNLIQEMQLKIDSYYDLVFEWIPYNQFSDIKEISRGGFATVYPAIWKDGQLNYDESSENYVKSTQSQQVALKCLHNSQNITNEFLNEIKTYSIKYYSNGKVYGISQNPDTKDYIIVLQDKFCKKCGEEYTDVEHKWCKPCQINNLKTSNLTSENEKIDNLIQEMQLKINSYNDLVFEWIPYNQFSDIKKIGRGGFATVYSAIWKNGQLNYNESSEKYVKSTPNQQVALKCLHNSQNITNEFLNKIKTYSIKYYSNSKVYGISQNPDTKDYIIVLQDKFCKKCEENVEHKWCKPCQIDNLTSGNEKIDNIIQEMQLKIDSCDDLVFEWIPYNQFSDIKEIGRSGFFTVYLAIWKNGQLNYNKSLEKYVKSTPNQQVALKCIHKSQNITNEFLNKIKAYSIYSYDDILKVYGISQNPNTKDYIIVLQDKFCKKHGEEYTYSNWCKSCQINNLKTSNLTSENEKIDNLIQEMQLKIDSCDDLVFEWIPYNQFSDIKKIGRGGFSTVYSAIWKDGLLLYDKSLEKYVKSTQNRKVALKCLHNSQNITNEFLNEIKAYSIKNVSDGILRVYGISQNPDTKNYIMVLNYAESGSLNNWMKIGNTWYDDMETLEYTIKGLRKIHEKKMIHRDFHIGNILLSGVIGISYISDMGLCGEVDKVDATKIYGVMPYVAPEVLRGKPYTQVADIYSFGMVMYFVATYRQPFADRAHDEFLAMQICDGIRPEITEKDAPKCYIDLMKKCWDPNPDDRPNATEILESITSFGELSFSANDNDRKIVKQFKEAYKYKKANLSSIKNNKTTTHPQAIYTSRLLNPYTTSLDIRNDENNQSITHPQAIYTSRLLNPYSTDLDIKIDWNESKNDQ